jgi:hypothetical protein
MAINAGTAAIGSTITNSELNASIKYPVRLMVHEPLLCHRNGDMEMV